MSFADTIGAIISGQVDRNTLIISFKLKAYTKVDKLIKFTSIEIDGKHFNFQPAFEKAAKQNNMAVSDAILKAQKEHIISLFFPSQIICSRVLVYRVEKKSEGLRISLAREK